MRKFCICIVLMFFSAFSSCIARGGNGSFSTSKTPPHTKEANRVLATLRKAARHKTPFLGHQDALMYGQNWWINEGDSLYEKSDIYDVCGKYPFILGLDLGRIERGQERNIDRCSFRQMKEAAIMHHKRGGLVTVSWHMDNPVSDDEVEKIKEYLLTLGDSLVCVADDEVIKIHVHTNHPGKAFEKGLEYGQLTRCKVDNMREEHNERISFAIPYEADDKSEASSEKSEEEKPQDPPKKYGFVAVSAGEGLSTIFEEIGVDYVIRGGQTMNPSTDDIISAIDKVNAENVFILPNNKNIVLAANQAAEIVDAKKVYVVTTATIPQGIAAMLEFNEALEPEENLEGMKEASLGIKTGEITFAVRDTSVEGKEIRKNNIMGISDNGIDAVGTDVEEVTKQLIDTLVDEDSGLISLYYGEDVSKEEAEAFAASLSEKYDDLDVDIRFGGQPIYYYILSVE